MLAVQQQKRLCRQFVDVSAARQGCHMMKIRCTSVIMSDKRRPHCGHIANSPFTVLSSCPTSEYISILYFTSHSWMSDHCTVILILWDMIAFCPPVRKICSAKVVWSRQMRLICMIFATTVWFTIPIFYSASALLAMQSAVIARGILSVCPSITFRYCVQTNEDTIVCMVFSFW